MDGPKAPEAPPTPTPYRDGKALTEIIPPDRRRQKTILLVAASMTAGIALWVVGGRVLEMATREDVPPPVIVSPPIGYPAGRIVPSVLHGPAGNIQMPPPGRSVVNVWLQGCADCMPAFEAMRDLESNGGLGVRVLVVNVAYGEADPSWAARYGVLHNLVFDQGGASVVKPLGIGTFTTLVIDSDGAIIHRDRPDRPGYRDRVRAAVGVDNVDPEPDHVDPLAEPHAVLPVADGTKFGVAAVERVVDKNRAQIKRACWDRAAEPRPETTDVRVTLTIASDGKVAGTAATGDDPKITKCVERETKVWVFPPPGSTQTVNIPFKFIRQ